MKKNKKTYIWVTIIAVVIGAIWFWRSREEKIEINLNTTQPIVGDIATTITATGTVQPVDTVAVGTQVSGTINKVYVDFNSVVKKGQLLAQLDRTILTAQAAQIQANLQQMKSNYAYQTSNYNRQQQLYKVGAISKADLEAAMNQFNASRDNVAATTAQLASANKNLAYTNIYSPIDGTVLSRNVSEGQTVAASFSTPTLFSIAKDLTKMQVRASIDEADIGNVKTGQNATFTVDAFPDKTFEGVVQEIRLHPTVSANVVNYVTIIDANNAELLLKPGMTANITVATLEIPKALKIPSKALSFKPDSLVAQKYQVQGMDSSKKNKSQHHKQEVSNTASGSTSGTSSGASSHAVVWVKKDMTLQKKMVEVGLNNETEAQILSGLDEKDVVVTGYQVIGNTKSGNSNSAKSPFMPQRGGGNKKQGGGGPR